MTHNPPSLLELAARVIKTSDIRYDEESIPRNLVEYLNCGHCCVNPMCKGQRLVPSKVRTKESDLQPYKRTRRTRRLYVEITVRTNGLLLSFAGVFFNNRVEHVKFVDFCGKYRLPLLQYLCSRKCIESRDGDEVVSGAMIRKVLLG